MHARLRIAMCVRVRCTSGAHRVRIPAGERSPGGGGRDSSRGPSERIGSFDPRGLDACSADIGIGLCNKQQKHGCERILITDPDG